MDSGRWDHLESWASPCPQGTKPVGGRRQVFAKWFFPFHLTVEFEPGAPPDDAALLRGLNPYERLYTDDLPTLDFFERLTPVFDLWKRGGTWEHVHPWMETVLPWETAPDLLDAILPDLPPSILVGGHVLLWPAKGNTSRSRLFMRPPGENLMGFGILPAIPPKFWAEAKPMLEHASRREVRRRKQTTVSLDIVQPGRPNHADRLSQGPLDVIEEGSEVRQSLTSALNPQRGESIRLGVAEVEADAIIA